MADLYDFTERLKLLLYGYHGKSKMNTRHFDDNFKSIDQFAKETDKGFSDEEKAREKVKSDLLKNITENKKLFDSHTADTVAHLTTDERQSWNDKYTKNEIDNKFSTLETATDWKEAVETYDDLKLVYRNPQDGWTVNVKDTDYTYRWSGSVWVAISANAVPKATNAVDGLMTKEDKVSLDTVTNKAHEHSNKSVLDGITSALIAKWNDVTSKLNLSGGTLTGFLTLHSNPTSDLHAATKSYVDISVASAGGGDMLKSVYDKNGNGKVDIAEMSESVDWDNVASKPSTFPASLHNHDAAYQTKAKKLENVTVGASSFVASSDFSQYPFHADVVISEITVNDYAEVNLSPASKALGAIAPDNQTMAGRLRIYATVKPSSNITLSTIVYERIV